MNLLDLSPQQLNDYLIKTLKEPKFRSKQILNWIYHHYVTNFDEMSNLSKVFKQKLKENCIIEAPKIHKEQRSNDGTIKWIMDANGQKIETVYIPEDNRGTLCVSSQAGCALNCYFCSTATQGFNRNLTTSEIIGQVWRAQQQLNPKNKKITNVVMMGMGEPLMNLKNLVPALELMVNDQCFGLSKRRVTVSTSGLPLAIDKLQQQIDVALALSLHAPNDKLRSEIMPINDKYPIKQVLNSVKNYIQNSKANHGKATIEYILLDNVNDFEENAIELSQLLKNLPCKINLIPFNPFPGNPYSRPSNNRIHKFQQILKQKGYIATIRKTRGDDIDAACGQLVGKIKDRTKRNAEYLNRIKIQAIQP